MMSVAFRELIERSERDADGLQPWPTYYRRRGLEIEMALRLGGIEGIGRALDVGCSSGFTSACLSLVAEEVIGLDLPRQSVDTHSVGMMQAREYFRRAPHPTCRLIGGSGESIPLKDRSVDFVYAMYVLEHVADKKRMLAECARVLVPGGRALILVPSFSERLQAPLAHLHYLLTRLWARRRSGGKAPAGDPSLRVAPSLASSNGGGLWSEFRRKNPSFPLPEPHGAYPSWWVELRQSTTRTWLGLFENTGLSVDRWFSTFLIPYGVLGIINGSVALRLYEKTDGFHLKWAGRDPVRRWGASVAVLARASS